MNKDTQSKSKNKKKPMEKEVVSQSVDEFVQSVHKSVSKAKRRSAKSYLNSSSVKPKKLAKKKVKAKKKTISKNRIKKVKKVTPVKSVQDAFDQFDEFQDLPTSYGETSVSLIARDPHWIYVYWEIASESIRLLQKQWKTDFANWIYTLRIFDVTLLDFDGIHANSFFDLDELHMNSRYIHVPNNNATYCAQIGLRSLDGTFAKLSQSNCVTTARLNQSAREELIWKEVQNNQEDTFIKAEIQEQHKAKIKQLDLTKKQLD